MKKTKRLFVAIAFKKEIITQFVNTMTGYRELITDKGIRWTAPASLHLTLCFLGERDASIIPDIALALDQSVINQQAFILQFKGLGVFPEKGKARIVWIGIEDPQNLRLLYNATLRQLLAMMDIDRPWFSPHVTIARIGDNTKSSSFDEIKQLISKNKETHFGKMMVEKVTLFESVLMPKGPIYSVIHESMLK
jgi:2'-5' RNA ligase